MLLIDDIKMAFTKPPKVHYIYMEKMAQDRFDIATSDNSSLENILDKFKEASNKRYAESMEEGRKWKRDFNMAHRRINIRMLAVWIAITIGFFGSFAYVELFY